MPVSIISREDALLVFGKWLDEETRLSCSGAFFGCSFLFVGRITAVSSEAVDLTATDPDCVLRLFPNWDDLAFGYAEPKDLPILVPERAKSSSALAVSLPLRFSVEDVEVGVVPKRQKLFFCELLEPE